MLVAAVKQDARPFKLKRLHLKPNFLNSESRHQRTLPTSRAGAIEDLRTSSQKLVNALPVEEMLTVMN